MCWREEWAWRWRVDLVKRDPFVWSPFWRTAASSKPQTTSFVLGKPWVPICTVFVLWVLDCLTYFSRGPVCQKKSKKVNGQETMLRCDAMSSCQEPLICPGGQSPRQIRDQCELSQPLQYTLRQPLAPIHKRTQSQFRPCQCPLTR